MPRITGLKQQVRPAIASARPANSQARAATTQASKVTARNTSLSGVLPGRSGTVNSTLQATAPMTCCCSVCTGLECLDRTRFFSGQLLTESDLNNEQSYMLAKNRLHNRYLQGWGVVCGLQVTCSACDQWVTINPGYAIDPCGNDIIVCTAQSFNVIQAINACCKPQAQLPTVLLCATRRHPPARTRSSSGASRFNIRNSRRTWSLPCSKARVSLRVAAQAVLPADAVAGAMDRMAIR
jgi:hypothetical protein